MILTDALRMGHTRGLSSLGRKRGRTSLDDLRDVGYEAPVLPSSSACCRCRAVLEHVNVSSPRTSCALRSAVQDTITSEQALPCAAVACAVDTACAVATAANTTSAASGFRAGSTSALSMTTVSLSSVASSHTITPAVGAASLQPSIPQPAVEASGTSPTVVLSTERQHQQQALQQHHNEFIPQQLQNQGQQSQLAVPQIWGSTQDVAPTPKGRVLSNAAQHVPCVVEPTIPVNGPLPACDNAPQPLTEPWHGLLLQDMLPLGVEQWAATLDMEDMQAGQMGIFGDNSSEWDDAEGHDGTPRGADASDYEDAFSEYGTTDEEEENNAIPPADLEAIMEEQARAWALTAAAAPGPPCCDVMQHEGRHGQHVHQTADGTKTDERSVQVAEMWC